MGIVALQGFLVPGLNQKPTEVQLEEAERQYSQWVQMGALPEDDEGDEGEARMDAEDSKEVRD